MSDLISRKSIIEKLENALLNDDLTIGEQGLLSDIVSFVAIETTAYDIDKVVEELKTDSSVKLYGSQNSDNYMIPVKRAIEIFKQGGVSDDVCEWKRDDTFRWMQAYKAGCCNKILDLTVIMALEMNQCPYCGKKIKAVE